VAVAGGYAAVAGGRAAVAGGVPAAAASLSALGAPLADLRRLRPQALHTRALLRRRQTGVLLAPQRLHCWPCAKKAPVRSCRGCARCVHASWVREWCGGKEEGKGGIIFGHKHSGKAVPSGSHRWLYTSCTIQERHEVDRLRVRHVLGSEMTPRRGEGGLGGRGESRTSVGKLAYRGSSNYDHGHNKDCPESLELSAKLERGDAEKTRFGIDTCEEDFWA